MNITKLTFDKINQFSKTDKAYVLGDKALQPYYKHEVNLTQFKEVIAQRNFPDTNRSVLCEVLEQQYKTIGATNKVLENLQALAKANTFTITTAHQPNLLTGPLYFIYKIVGAINLAEQLNTTYPDQQFVPVYWMGGEDHDFEEVNYFNIFGKKVVWDDKQGGSVSRYQIESLLPVLEEVYGLLGDSENAQNLKGILSKSYEQSTDYGDFSLRLVNQLFGHYGLIVLDSSHKAFKSLMKPIFREELLKHSSQTLVQETAAQLQALGFKNQAYARAINLFHLLPNDRVRIVKEEGRYKALDTGIEWSEEELLEELEKYPESFSPNVILRPLFQETILPNLAYIGGGGELAYWLERKTQFEHYNIPFPMLIRRNSVLWIDKGQSKKLAKFGFSMSEIFEDTEALIKQYVHAESEEELHFESEKGSFNQVFEQILAKTIAIDSTLGKGVQAQQAQLYKALEKLEKRLVKHKKQQHDTVVQQIRKWKDKLFPKNGLQERHDNFIALYLRYGDVFIQELKAHLHPLEKQFVVVQDS
ncbi:MAG: bacillithiol biosynthesis cysteine-adding enzyme BshC [Aureispira sp.]|nr:bacillithiol biosynthesis cysteine-adding enzyme BshC [Aureispira sp.]